MIIIDDVLYDNVKGRVFNQNQVSNINILKCILPTSFGRFFFALGVKYDGYPKKIPKFLNYKTIKNIHIKENKEINKKKNDINYIVNVLFSEKSANNIRSILLDS